MTMGGSPANDWGADDVPETLAQEAADLPESFTVPDEERLDEEEPDVLARPSLVTRIPGLVLLLIAAVWMAAVTWKLFGDNKPLTGEAANFLAIAALAAGPVALIAIGWLLVGPTSRREASRMAHAAAAMRGESARLQVIMEELGERIEANSRAVGAQIGLLETRGAETSETIAGVNASMAENISTLARHSLLLGAAATSAREEMKTLMVDLPDAETRVKALTDLIRSAGHIVDNQAAGLQSQLLGLTQRAKEADEATGKAAAHLAGHIDRIEQGTREAAHYLHEAGVQMAQSVDAALEKAGRATDESRRNLDAQGQAMIALIERGRAALDQAGLESSQFLTSRLDEIAHQIDLVGTQLAAQESASTSLFSSLQRGLADAEQRFAVLNDGASEKTADLAEVIVALTGHAERLAGTLGTSAQSAGDLLRQTTALRETIEALAAGQAAMHGALPLAERIDEAARSVTAQVGGTGEALARQAETLAELQAAAEHAAAAAQRAGDMLTRQIKAVIQSADGIEARIAAAAAEIDHADQKHFSRQASLLIEALNSTAIDVTKILSNEVTDAAWAAYLKGDRGVFTRRAVRLLDASEARDILRHYEEDAEFREQVNRYIHDFEAMLRHVLASRDGTPLGVTLLSSDMGKLYVALAQAIERLRT